MKRTRTSPAQRQELVQRSVEGDRDALQRLIVEYHGPLLGTVTGRMDAALRRHVAPEDILQEAYLGAFKSIGRCSFANPAAFYKWLERIALDQLKNTGRNLRRDRRNIDRERSRAAGRKTSLLDLVDGLSSQGPTPSRHLAKKEASAAAISSLARLPEHYRQVVEMRFLQGRPVTEIAAELGKSEGAIHMSIKRSLDKLRHFMGSISSFLTGK